MLSPMSMNPAYVHYQFSHTGYALDDGLNVVKQRYREQMMEELSNNPDNRNQEQIRYAEQENGHQQKRTEQIPIIEIHRNDLQT